MSSGAAPASKPARVFLSYSHDSLKHKERVLALSNKLRSHGIDSVVDRYFEDTLEMRWTKWMTDQITGADFVLVVATEGYLQRIESDSEGEPGRGVNWEGALLTESLYEQRGKNQKIFPIYFSPEDTNYIPLFLKGFAAYNVSEPEGYAKLYRRLTRQPEVLAPPIGAVVDPAQLLAPLPPVGSLENPGHVYSLRTPPPAGTERQAAAGARIDQLCSAYAELRTQMSPSDARTRRMEALAARMRVIACDAYYLLEHLALNPNPGSRLAAVSLLEAKPHPDYLDWLAERVAPEKPFVGYHAALALLMAARALGAEFTTDVRKAIEKAREQLGPGLQNTDRARALAAALQQLDDTATLSREFGITDQPLPA